MTLNQNKQALLGFGFAQARALNNEVSKDPFLLRPTNFLWGIIERQTWLFFRRGKLGLRSYLGMDVAIKKIGLGGFVQLAVSAKKLHEIYNAL